MVQSSLVFVRVGFASALSCENGMLAGFNILFDISKGPCPFVCDWSVLRQGFDVLWFHCERSRVACILSVCSGLCLVLCL